MPIITPRSISPRSSGHLAVVTISVVLAAFLTAGCHDDTPPPGTLFPSDTAANTPPPAPAVSLPPSAVSKPIVIPVSAAKKKAKPTAKSYLQTDAAGIVILHSQKPQEPIPSNP